MEGIKLGLKENWRQFTLLVVVNAFVGGMVGMERSILPEIAEQEFGMVVKTAILSFIVVFGITKAIANYYTGALANKVGRKNLLTIGWLFALPVPFILMYAPNWNWIVFANALLGINQGLTWSSTVVMKIDLVGEKNRGLAMGLNESVGYLAVGGVAFLTGWVASEYGLRPYPFYLGVGFAILGILFSWLFVKDTIHHVNYERVSSNIPKLKKIFWETSWGNKNLGSISQAGLVNNLNDGMVWGLFPLFLATRNFSIEEIGTIVAIYPSVWGLGQLFTGKLADLYDKKQLLFWGMFAQGAALFVMIWATSFTHFAILSVVLGLGTALVYPTFLAGVAQFTHPEQRAKSIGIFRLWRDLGYAVGAILTGVIADSMGLISSVAIISILTIMSSLIILFRMNTKMDLHPKCISQEELENKLFKGKILLVDVRSNAEYMAQHIEGAVNIHKEDFERNIEFFKQYDLIVTACGKGGGRSEEAAKMLNAMGIKANWLYGGTFGWLK